MTASLPVYGQARTIEYVLDKIARFSSFALSVQMRNIGGLSLIFVLATAFASLMPKD